MMKRRNFIRTLLALPFAGKAIVSALGDGQTVFTLAASAPELVTDSAAIEQFFAMSDVEIMFPVWITDQVYRGLIDATIPERRRNDLREMW